MNTNNQMTLQLKRYTNATNLLRLIQRKESAIEDNKKRLAIEDAKRYIDAYLMFERDYLLREIENDKKVILLAEKRYEKYYKI